MSVIVPVEMIEIARSSLPCVLDWPVPNEGFLVKLSILITQKELLRGNSQKREIILIKVWVYSLLLARVYHQTFFKFRNYLV